MALALLASLSFCCAMEVLKGLPHLLAQCFCRRAVQWRPAWCERWLGLVAPRARGKKGMLLYAASLGELLLLERLLPLLAREQPHADLIVLVPTPSVLRVARERLGAFRAHCVTPLVLGTRGRLLRRLAPDLLVVVEFARIPLWIRAARQQGVRLAIVNGRISGKNQRACRRWPALFRPMLAAFDRVYAQTESDAAEFRRHGARRQAVEVAGALKFEAAATDREATSTRRLAEQAGIAAGDVVLLAGSTTGDEEEIVAGVFQQLAPRFPQLRLILAPRNRRRFRRVARILTRRGLAFQRRTQLAAGCARVLLVDTVGELAAWWGAAHIGFVGASLVARGGHNMIEPAALGVATCFGPHTDDFRDVAALLLENGAAARVAGAAELRAFVEKCLTEPAYAAALSQRAQATCRAQTGAMRQTCDRLSELLSEQRVRQVVEDRLAGRAAGAAPVPSLALQASAASR
jgi:3-deoxy-D-manno-octulosonic-acid transferase